MTQVFRKCLAPQKQMSALSCWGHCGQMNRESQIVQDSGTKIALPNKQGNMQRGRRRGMQYKNMREGEKDFGLFFILTQLSFSGLSNYVKNNSDSSLLKKKAGIQRSGFNQSTGYATTVCLQIVFGIAEYSLQPQWVKQHTFLPPRHRKLYQEPQANHIYFLPYVVFAAKYIFYQGTSDGFSLLFMSPGPLDEYYIFDNIWHTVA